MIDIIEAYNEYLQIDNKIKSTERELQAEGRLSASSAGLCAKKFWFQKNKYAKKDLDGKTLRLFRLGTLVGNDIEKAMKYISNTPVKVFTEEYIYDHVISIGGSFDLLVVDADKKGYLYDYKTCNLGKWGSIFKWKNSNQSNNYEFQLGTYAMILNRIQKYCDEVVSMSLLFYNKNDSEMKYKEVSMDYIDFARKYWEKALVIANQDKEPGNGPLVPYYPKWECGPYCSYVDSCNSEYIKERKK